MTTTTTTVFGDQEQLEKNARRLAPPTLTDIDPDIHYTMEESSIQVGWGAGLGTETHSALRRTRH
jgi:hypothetical protein